VYWRHHDCQGLLFAHLFPRRCTSLTSHYALSLSLSLLLSLSLFLSLALSLSLLLTLFLSISAPMYIINNPLRSLALALAFALSLFLSLLFSLVFYFPLYFPSFFVERCGRFSLLTHLEYLSRQYWCLCALAPSWLSRCSIFYFSLPFLYWRDMWCWGVESHSLHTWNTHGIIFYCIFFFRGEIYLFFWGER